MIYNIEVIKLQLKYLRDLDKHIQSEWTLNQLKLIAFAGHTEFEEIVENPIWFDAFNSKEGLKTINEYFKSEMLELDKREILNEIALVDGKELLESKKKMTLKAVKMLTTEIGNNYWEYLILKHMSSRVLPRKHEHLIAINLDPNTREMLIDNVLNLCCYHVKVKKDHLLLGKLKKEFELIDWIDRISVKQFESGRGSVLSKQKKNNAPIPEKFEDLFIDKSVAEKIIKDLKDYHFIDSTSERWIFKIRGSKGVLAYLFHKLSWKNYFIKDYSNDYGNWKHVAESHFKEEISTRTFQNQFQLQSDKEMLFNFL